MNKILVTGSKGQLGQALQKIAGPNLAFTSREVLDITDEVAVADYLRDGNYDFVINCAAYTAVDKAESEPDICRSVNVDGVRNLAKHCELAGSILIHISSDYVYHPKDQRPINETDPCSPQGVYALTKLQGEEEIRRLLPRHIILRTSWVYSEVGHNFVKTMLRLSETMKSLKIVSDQIGSPTYALDLAEAILKIVQGPFHYGTYNFSNLGYISWADFAQEIFRQADKNIEIQRIPTEDYPTPAARPLNSRLIKSKIADDYHISLKYWKYSLTKCLEKIDN